MKNIKLPSGWQEKKLKDLFENFNEKNHADKTILASTQDRGVIPNYLLGKDIIRKEDSLSTYKLVKKGCFVISLRSFQGGFEYSNYEGIVSPAYTILKPKIKFEPLFYKAYFKSHYFINKSLAKYVEGIRDGRQIRYEECKDIVVPFPPIDEQKRIADILSLCDDIIENLTKLIEKKELYKKGMMQRVLTGKVRFNGFTDEWETVRLGDIAEMSSGGTPSTKNKEYYNGDIIWVAIKDITSSNKFLYDSEKKITKEGLNNSSAKLFPINTILYAMYASIGECIIAKVECATSQAILGIECSEKIDFTFLYYLLVNYKNNAKKMRQTGTQPNLNKQIVSDFQFYIPKMKEQKRIAELLSTIDDEIDNLKKQLELRKLQKKGLMQRLLTGEVRV